MPVFSSGRIIEKNPTLTAALSPLVAQASTGSARSRSKHLRFTPGARQSLLAASPFFVDADKEVRGGAGGKIWVTRHVGRADVAGKAKREKANLGDAARTVRFLRLLKSKIAEKPNRSLQAGAVRLESVLVERN